MDVVLFDELELSDDLHKMNVACHLSDEAISAGYVISEVNIEYYKNRLATGVPSSRAKKIVFSPGVNEVDLTGDTAISDEEFSEVNNGFATFEGGLFYVLVGAKIPQDAVVSEVLVETDTDDDDIDYYAGVIIDWQTFYDLGMGYVVSMTRRCNKYACEIPMGFEQFIILWHAFNLAYESEDLDQLDFLWGRLMMTGGTDTKCNCG